MHQLDLYIALFLLLSIIIGTIRGFAGELGSLLKLTLTIFISYKILDIIHETIDIPIVQNILFPIITYGAVYIVTSFILKILIYQMVFLLRSATPFIIDKPLGTILGLAKSILIVTILYIIISTAVFTLNTETPKWLKHTLTEKYCTYLSLKLLNLIPNIEYNENNIGDNSLLLHISPISSSLNNNNTKEKNDTSNIIKQNIKDPGILEGVLELLKHRKMMEELDEDTTSETESYSMDELIEKLETN